MNTTVSETPDIAGRWHGRFEGDGTRGLELDLRDAGGGAVAGRGWVGPLSAGPSGGPVAGAVGPGGEVSLELRPDGRAGGGPVTLRGALSGGVLQVTAPGGTARLTRSAPPQIASAGYATVTFVFNATTWVVSINNETQKWSVTSGPPLSDGSSGLGDIVGFLLWPSWLEARDQPPVHSPYPPSFKFEWQNTQGSPAPLSTDHSWLITENGSTVYPTGGSVAFGP